MPPFSRLPLSGGSMLAHPLSVPDSDFAPPQRWIELANPLVLGHPTRQLDIARVIFVYGSPGAGDLARHLEAPLATSLAGLHDALPPRCFPPRQLARWPAALTALTLTHRSPSLYPSWSTARASSGTAEPRAPGHHTTAGPLSAPASSPLSHSLPRVHPTPPTTGFKLSRFLESPAARGHSKSLPVDRPLSAASSSASHATNNSTSTSSATGRRVATRLIGIGQSQGVGT
ncbi:hypothetical protein K438DRAFT_712607 [Mycena galopus ATCC 62051]|nr:hypothetical protein K438DRAFT_712607 [Mycena galopus ATCC 62051]